MRLATKQKPAGAVSARGGFHIAPAFAAGIVAGIVFLVLEMGLLWGFMGASIWDPARMIAAIVLGRDVLPAPGAASPPEGTVIFAATVLHLGLSVLYAGTLALLTARMTIVPAFGVGILFGLALYAINFYGFTALFPWFADARNWVGILSHAVFGAVAVLTYFAVARPRVQGA